VKGVIGVRNEHTYRIAVWTRPGKEESCCKAGDPIWRFMTNDVFVVNRLDEDPAVFQTRFWRCHRLLDFIACRVLGSSERADGAIENCWMRASRHPPRFAYEGAFRCWLVRVLIDEALAILQSQRSAGNEIRFRRNSFGARNQLCEKRVVLLNAATEGEY
jgi:DNA-directed RNA polymerase specialized sigma24 family protein